MKTVRLAVVEGTPIPVRIFIKKEGEKGKAPVDLNPEAAVSEEQAKNLVKAYPGRYVILTEGAKIDLTKYPVNTTAKKVELDPLIAKLDSAQLEKVRVLIVKLIAESGGTDTPAELYEGWTVEKLNDEIEARRDAGREIAPTGKKKDDLIRALELDDDANVE